MSSFDENILVLDEEKDRYSVVPEAVIMSYECNCLKIHSDMKRIQEAETSEECIRLKTMHISCHIEIVEVTRQSLIHAFSIIQRVACTTTTKMYKLLDHGV